LNPNSLQTSKNSGRSPTNALVAGIFQLESLAGLGIDFRESSYWLKLQTGTRKCQSPEGDSEARIVGYI
jgi:hypothetical protein